MLGFCSLKKECLVQIIGNHLASILSRSNASSMDSQQSSTLLCMHNQGFTIKSCWHCQDVHLTKLTLKLGEHSKTYIDTA